MIYNCKIKHKLMIFMRKIKYKLNTKIQIKLYKIKIYKFQVNLIIKVKQKLNNKEDDLEQSLANIDKVLE